MSDYHHIIIIFSTLHHSLRLFSVSPRQVLAEKAAKDKIENPNADTASEKEAELMELIQKKKEALVFQGRKTRANLMQFELAKAEVERQVRLDAERQKRVAAEIAAERVTFIFSTCFRFSLFF
jgi:hypothetical protein